MIERAFLNRVRVTLLSSAAAVMALAVAFTQFAHAKAGKTESKAPPPKVAVDTNPLKRETKLTTSFAPVVKKVAPSVVNVFISSTPKMFRSTAHRCSTSHFSGVSLVTNSISASVVEKCRVPSNEGSVPVL